MKSHQTFATNRVSTDAVFVSANSMLLRNKSVISKLFRPSAIKRVHVIIAWHNPWLPDVTRLIV